MENPPGPQSPNQSCPEHPPERKRKPDRSFTGITSIFSGFGSTHGGHKKGPIGGELDSSRASTFHGILPSNRQQQSTTQRVGSYDLTKEALQKFLDEKWQNKAFKFFIFERHDSFVIEGGEILTEEDRRAIGELRTPKDIVRRPSR